ISTNHLSECGLSALSSHLRISQKTSAVSIEEKAYTSPSTAENQKVSENVYTSAPTTPLPMTAMICPLLSILLPLLSSSLRVRCVIVQKRKRMVKALISADMLLIIIATCEGSCANWLKRFPTSMKKGAPGG